MLTYSGGQGRLYTELKGYEPCHNAQEVIEAIGYDAQRDTQNPCSSVFCAHGAGFVVEWEQVEDYMHLENVLTESSSELQEQDGRNVMSTIKRVGQGRMIQRKEQETSASSDFIGQDEIDEIMNRTYGTKERKKQGWAKTIRGNNRSDREVNLSDKGNSHSTLSGREKRDRKNTDSQEEYLLVDGYNIIFAWDYLKELAEENLDGARGRLMDILSNFQGSRGMHLILVFDAYKVKGNPGSMERYHNIDVVYTKEAETADQYIEKVTHEIGRKHRVRVATSDGLEQLIIMGAGAVRVSAGEFWEEVTATSDELRQTYLDGTNRPMGDKKYLFADASDEVTAYVEQMRLGNSADYLDKTNREE